MMRYAVIGGNYFRAYTGTGTYSGLTVLGKVNTIEEANRIVLDKYDECGGLIEIVDMDTNAQFDWNENVGG